MRYSPTSGLEQLLNYAARFYLDVPMPGMELMEKCPLWVKSGHSGSDMVASHAARSQLEQTLVASSLLNRDDKRRHPRPGTQIGPRVGAVA